MTRPFVITIIALVVIGLFVFTVATGNRMAAGGGALVLLLGIGYGTWQSKRATPAQKARSERSAREVREEIAEEEAR